MGTFIEPQYSAYRIITGEYDRYDRTSTSKRKRTGLWLIEKPRLRDRLAICYLTMNYRLMVLLGWLPFVSLIAATIGTCIALHSIILTVASGTATATYGAGAIFYWEKNVNGRFITRWVKNAVADHRLAVIDGKDGSLVFGELLRQLGCKTCEQSAQWLHDNGGYAGVIDELLREPSLHVAEQLLPKLVREDPQRADKLRDEVDARIRLTAAGIQHNMRLEREAAHALLIQQTDALQALLEQHAHTYHLVSVPVGDDEKAA